MKWIALLLAAVVLFFVWSSMQESARNTERLEAKGKAALQSVQEVPAQKEPTAADPAVIEARRLLATPGKAVSETVSLTGWTFDGGKVVEVFPDGVKIVHETGGGRLNYKDLPPEIRAKFSLDEKIALKFAEARRIVASVDAAAYQAKQKASAEARKLAAEAEAKRKIAEESRTSSGRGAGHPSGSSLGSVGGGGGVIVGGGGSRSAAGSSSMSSVGGGGGVVVGGGNDD